MPHCKKYYCDSSSSSDNDCCWPFGGFPFFPFLGLTGPNVPVVTVNLGGDNEVNIPFYLLSPSCAEQLVYFAALGGLTGPTGSLNPLLFTFLSCKDCRRGKCKKHKYNCNGWWNGCNGWWWNGCYSDSSSSSSSSSCSSSCGCLYIDRSSSSSSCWHYKKSPLYCKMKKKNGRRKLKCKKLPRYYHDGHNGHNGQNNNNAGQKKEFVL